MAAHTLNAGTKGAEADGSLGVWGQPSLQCEFQDSEHYVERDPVSKKKRKKKKKKEEKEKGKEKDEKMAENTDAHILKTDRLMFCRHYSILFLLILRTYCISGCLLNSMPIYS